MRSSLPLALSLFMTASALLCGCGEPRVIVNDPSWTPPENVRIVDDRIVIDRHINFELDSDVILPDSSELLDNIADVINHHANIQTLRVVGHTDAAGSAEHNQDLSERRARAVATALQQRSVSIRLLPSGEGETQHLCQDDTEACHAQNRRVEFIIVQ